MENFIISDYVYDRVFEETVGEAQDLLEKQFKEDIRENGGTQPLYIGLIFPDSMDGQNGNCFQVCDQLGILLTLSEPLGLKFDRIHFLALFVIDSVELGCNFVLVLLENVSQCLLDLGDLTLQLPGLFALEEIDVALPQNFEDCFPQEEVLRPDGPLSLLIGQVLVQRHFVLYVPKKS